LVIYFEKQLDDIEPNAMRRIALSNKSQRYQDGKHGQQENIVNDEVKSVPIKSSLFEIALGNGKRYKTNSKSCISSSTKRFLYSFFLFFVWIMAVAIIENKFGSSKLRFNLRQSNMTHGRKITQQTTDFQRYSEKAPLCTPLTVSQVSYTLVTQLSIDRLWMMKYHCDRWGSSSPISVAILTNQTTANTKQALLQMGCPSKTLTVQTLPISSNSDALMDYPVNHLRRMALSQVRTSHVMYVDIDFWESENLHDILHQTSVREALAADNKLSLVVPAFQLNRRCTEYRECPEKNIPQMPRTWQNMVDTIMDRHGSPFDPTNRGGHGSTLYSRWIKQNPGELLPLSCIKSNRYEPYLAFRYCHDLPPFQTHFSGYGKNKMTWVMQLRREGYIFSQLGGAFVVHYPHLDSASRMQWNEGPKELQPIREKDGSVYKKRPSEVAISNWETYKRGKVDAIFFSFRKWLRLNVPDTTRVPMCSDSEDDDHRLWISRPKRDKMYH
jgi:Glycosyl-transferase for dystroglycan